MIDSVGMDGTFRRVVVGLEAKFQELMAREPARFGSLRPADVRKPGVYAFFENGAPLYVGRSKNIHRRLGNHCRGRASQTAFAFRLAREKTGNTKATYAPNGSRRALAANPAFAAAFLEVQARIREMDVRFVEEPDPVAQALLEIYVTVALNTPYNDFDTH